MGTYFAAGRGGFRGRVGEEAEVKFNIPVEKAFEIKLRYSLNIKINYAHYVEKNLSGFGRAPSGDASRTSDSIRSYSPIV